MATDAESIELVARWRGGDERAAEVLVQRFTGRLLAVARSRLSHKLARRFDAEDVVQSAYRSFFSGARADRYVLERSGDLWRLLVAITLNKLGHQVERHTAAKRSIKKEQGFGTESSLLGLQAELLAREPSPDQAAAVVDEVEHVMRPLSPLHRQMVEMRLQDHTVPEIAAATGRSERLVRRVLEQLKDRLQQRCREYAGS